MITIYWLGANSEYPEMNNIGLADLSCMSIQLPEFLSSLTPAYRYKLTRGVLVNGRVFNRHRRRLSAITATFVRRCFFKRLHAQSQKREDRLAQP